MITSASIDATVFYKHLPEEIAGLRIAIIPMADHIRAASGQFEKAALKRILAGQYFRAGHAAAVHSMLLHAAKYARAHLSDYFPLMRAGILADAEALEIAAQAYWNQFKKLSCESVPTP